jgi:ferredoxin
MSYGSSVTGSKSFLAKKGGDRISMGLLMACHRKRWSIVAVRTRYSKVSRNAVEPGLVRAVRTERFGLQTVSQADNVKFSVVLARQGSTVDVPPGKSILEVVDESGVDVPSSCLAGMCRTCETRVLDGTPEHRDSVLAEQEQLESEYIMICVSRAKTAHLVLDI